jgi:hypothetical protein
MNLCSFKRFFYFFYDNFVMSIAGIIAWNNY